jgi:hypothetical protein
VIVVLAVAAVAALGIGFAVGRTRLHRPPGRRTRGRRILVPFSGALDSAVLDAAIRIASAEDAVLVPAYLLVVPLQYPEDSAQKDKVAIALPLLEAVERAALKAGVPVDARIEKGRSLTHALSRLWEVERFDRIVAPSTGFEPKELAWILTHAPYETVVLRPATASLAA